jgi:hypothetical protein
MTMLKLIGFLIALYTLYQIIDRFNRYTQENAGYEFFTMEHTLAMVSGYVVLYFGWVWGSQDKDWLDGIIVMLIGLTILTLTIKNNFNQTPRLFAVAGSLMQIIFYIPITLLIIPIVFLAFMYFSQIKPLYNVNSGD